MKKYGGLENSEETDSQYGLAIFVSTTARITFRQANPSYSKVRNSTVNKALAKSFSSSSPVGYFQTKKGSDEGVGEIRESMGAKYIAIIYGSYISIVAVKKAPIVPAPIEASKKIKMKKRASNFFLSHLMKQAQEHLDIDSVDMQTLISYLKGLYGGSTKSILQKILKNKNKDGVEALISKIHLMELGKEPVYNTIEPNDSFSVPQGVALNVDY